MKTDNELQTDVLNAIRSDIRLSGSEIFADVKDGVVSLTGSVDSYTKKLAAEEAAGRVQEIKGIVEGIGVSLARGGKRNDRDLAYAAINALIYDSKENIKVLVENGWITLEGNVTWPYQKDAAVDAISEIAGLRGVTNHINVNPLMSYSF